MDPASPTASTSSIAPPPPSDPLAPAPTDSPAVPLSKSAAKKAVRKAAYEAAKPARRAREKLQKKEKAAEKRKLVELGVLEKPLSKKTVRQGPKKPWNVRIVVDLDFEGKMTEKEIKSMASQLAFCYSSNRLSPNPVPLLVSSLVGPIQERLVKSTNSNYHSWRGVEFWDEGYEEIWSEKSKEVDAGVLKGLPRARTRKEDVVYLTGDSPNVLTELEEGKTYILGGIVDRNRYKNLCFDKAVAQGISHAQLPISEFLPEMTTRKILTVNQVFEIIVQWGEKRDWQAALRAVMPTRKFEDGKKGKKGATEGEENEVYVAQEEEEEDEEMEEAEGAEEERAERALAKAEAEAGEEGEAGEVEMLKEQSEEQPEPEQTIP